MAMGFIGKAIKHYIEDSVREVTTELYDNYNKTSILCSPAGIETLPILGDPSIPNDDKYDQLILSTIDDAGHTAIIGVVSKATIQEGELKLFSRDPKTGIINSEIYLRADKLLVIKNDVENLKLIMNDLIKEIKAMKTFGSPSNHTVDPATQALLDAVDARINALLGE
jgi:hypothetical protein